MDSIISFLEKREAIEQATAGNLQQFFKTPRKIYLGIDPTAGSLHLGHLIGLVMQLHFSRFGHKPVFVIGGATALIGDPSGKDKERPLRSLEEIQQNAKKLKSFIYDFFDKQGIQEKPLIVNNYDWFSAMDMIVFLRDVGKQFRIGPMLAKESVKKRVASEEGMSFTEFSYQLLQAYDFYHLLKHEDVHCQIGGSDQFGNITAGIEFIRKTQGQSAHGLTFPLLTRADGKKFGKSEGGAIWLDDKLTSTFDFYQYLYRIPDADVFKALCLLTTLDSDKLQDLKSTNHGPNFCQKILAQEVTKLVHGEKGLREAMQATKSLQPGKLVFDKNNLSDAMQNLPHKSIAKGRVLGKAFLDVMLLSELCSSKGEIRRLIQNGGAYLNGDKVDDPFFLLSEKHILPGNLFVLHAGKKKAILMKIEES